MIFFKFSFYNKLSEVMYFPQTTKKCQRWNSNPHGVNLNIPIMSIIPR